MIRLVMISFMCEEHGHVATDSTRLAQRRTSEHDHVVTDSTRLAQRRTSGRKFNIYISLRTY